MSSFRASGLGRRLPAALALLVLTVAGAAPASAATEGSIDHVEAEGSGIRVLYSINGPTAGATPDLSSLKVTVDGAPLEATAELAADADAETTIRRTTILAMDVSRSMRGERFTQAKLAAAEFLAGVSPDVYVGIVAFAGDVTTVQEPSLDRAESVRRLDELTLTLETRLYDGVLHAVEATGTDGQRSVLVLSDGADTSETALEDVTAAIDESGVKVDVVALAQGGGALAALESMAAVGEGAVLAADDPEALTRVFSKQAAELAQQVLVTAELPADLAATEGTVSVSLRAGEEVYTDSAFVPLTDGTPAADPASEPQPATSTGVTVSKSVMLAGLVAAGVGVLFLLLSAFGVLGSSRPQSLEDRIAAYSRSGRPHEPGHRPPQTPGATAPQSLTSSAVGVAEKALASNSGIAASIGARLEAAGMSLKPAEWLLMHAGIAFGAGLVGFLVSGGGALMMVLFLLAGAVLPWLYLSFKQGRRLAKFNGQLADTLQLVSGGLSAGLSFAQSLDTVVRQGSEPMTTEFRRALIEARLGVDIEDALDDVADRMQSNDFRWVVIAVRIQREVGGNLAEVLGQVAATIREREYLHRQVKSLSAEGKMSAWILGLLPVVVFAFLMLTNGTYFTPMFTNLLGLVMIGAAVVMMTIAVFWMRKLVRMEV
jgi:tight adherence protein B